MLKLSSDLNFPWEQKQYIKVYKRVLALGSHKTHYITAPSDQTAIRSCVSSAYSYLHLQKKISRNKWEFTELRGQDRKDGEIVKKKGQLFYKYFDIEQTKSSYGLCRATGAVTSLSSSKRNMSVSTWNVWYEPWLSHK